ncbi:MAG: sugar phosphate isomerase/epimerase [Kiritimatiellaeota bacterium]|nr:sugar phosphate isomerase/epimerase [Kiritimatiellota bacterium]
MKLSIMLFPFDAPLADGRYRPEQVVETFLREGVTGIESMQRGVERAPDSWRRFLAMAREAGLGFPCHDINVNLIGSGSSADRDAAIDTVRRGVAFCRNVLRAPTALLAGTAPVPDLDLAESRRRYAAALGAALEATGDSGVTLAIEDYGVYPTFTASARHCREILGAPGCERLGFVFDNGNFVLADERPSAVLDSFMDRIVHVHIKDFARRAPDGRPSLTSPSGVPYRGALLGEGEAEVTEVVSALAVAEYGGWISLEVSGALGDPLEEAVHGLRFIRNAWNAGRPG